MKRPMDWTKRTVDTYSTPVPKRRAENRPFLAGDKVCFKNSSEFKANNIRGPFIVVREETNSDPYISIKDRNNILFSASGEGLWHKNHFELC